MVMKTSGKIHMAGKAQCPQHSSAHWEFPGNANISWALLPSRWHSQESSRAQLFLRQSWEPHPGGAKKWLFKIKRTSTKSPGKAR